MLLGQPAWALIELAPSYGQCASTAISQTFDVGPADDYQAVVDAAQSGDRVRFASGIYDDGLLVYDRNGSPDQCIVIEGPADRSAVFIGAPLNGDRNVVQIRNIGSLSLGFKNRTWRQGPVSPTLRRRALRWVQYTWGHDARARSL